MSFEIVRQEHVCYVHGPFGILRFRLHGVESAAFCAFCLAEQFAKMVLPTVREGVGRDIETLLPQVQEPED